MHTRSTASDGFSLRLVTVYRTAPGLVNCQSLPALESAAAIADELAEIPRT